MTITQYQVIGLTCGGCVKRVTDLLNQYAEEAVVTLEPPLATLTSPSATLIELNEKLALIGSYKLLPHQTTRITNNRSVEKSWFKTYQPLLTVIAYLLGVTLTIEFRSGEFILANWMEHFMAGFFLIFSFFKLLDITGFAGSYSMYDLLAKRWHVYGLIYPFIELALGIWYLLDWQPQLRNWVTLILMSFSTIGVIVAVMNRQQIRCACLGTGFNLPMSTVTIIEDLSMVLMATWMILTTT